MYEGLLLILPAWGLKLLVLLECMRPKATSTSGSFAARVHAWKEKEYKSASVNGLELKKRKREAEPKRLRLLPSAALMSKKRVLVHAALSYKLLVYEAFSY